MAGHCAWEALGRALGSASHPRRTPLRLRVLRDTGAQGSWWLAWPRTSSGCGTSCHQLGAAAAVGTAARWHTAIYPSSELGDTRGTRSCLVLSICAPKHPSPRQDPPSCGTAGSRQTAGQAGSLAGGSRAWNTCHLATETHRMVMTPSAKNLQAFDTLFNLMLLSLILNCIYRH